ncbi:MAG TPA: hypothetical protein VGR87_15800 [Candidatus Limnocylindria bacterium]|jgi:hypothetical protein|nr:hypothetical protein [Candidatus Limnocylindria bacterium]
MAKLVALVVRTPAGHLLAVWAFAVGLFALGPIHYNHPPGLPTWFFVGGCIALFCVGAWLGISVLRRGTAATMSTASRLDRIVWVTALFGVFGAGCIAVDKLLLSGLDFSQGVTAIRFAREEAVDAGTALALPRSPLLYLGYLTFGFSVPAYLLSILQGEALRRRTTWLAFASLASPFAYSYLYGGRSPLFLVLGMACGAIAVRLLSRQRALPRGRTAPILFVAFVALTLVYSNWIVSERFVATRTADYPTLEQRFRTTYDAEIPRVEGEQLSQQLLMHGVLYTYYFSHELPILERTLQYEHRVGPYYGAYQFYLLAAFVERVVPAWNVDVVMIPQLKAANVYGWFSTAWGGMYLDFGLLGALVGALLSGWLAGRVYRRALVDHTDGARLLMCYAVAGIIATPILSIFTISISLPILFSLLITSLFMRSARTSPATANQPTGAPAPVR